VKLGKGILNRATTIGTHEHNLMHLTPFLLVVDQNKKNLLEIKIVSRKALKWNVQPL
jgi:hypothetical protein